MKFKFVYLNFSFIIIFNNITFISLSLDSGQHSTHIPENNQISNTSKSDTQRKRHDRTRQEELGG